MFCRPLLPRKLTNPARSASASTDNVVATDFDYLRFRNKKTIAGYERLNLVIGGQPLGFWLVAFAFWLFLSLRRLRRVKQRRKNPFKDVNPTPSAITCPRCSAPWPGGYEPRSYREHMWKGVVCPNCGCEYDERGRERRE